MFSFFKKESAPAIFPRIKHNNFIEMINSIPDMPTEQKPISKPIIGDLQLTYAIDTGQEYISITPAELKKQNLTEQDLHDKALANGLISLQNLTVSDDDSGIKIMSSENNMTACSILFPELWEQIEGEIGSKPLVAFPHRDIVFYTSSNNKDGVENLRQAINRIDFSDTHALSGLIFQPSAKGWEIIET